MKFKLITPHAPEYFAERLLRWEALAKPLGMPPGSEVHTEEMQSLHLIAMVGKKLVGCICFNPETEVKGHIWAMAISDEYEGRSFSRKMVQALEEQLIERKIHQVYLYARPDLEEFYSLLGYRAEGEEIMERGIKHKMMKKILQATHDPVS